MDCYTISYDKEDHMWNADPKARTVRMGRDTYKYTFPESVVYVEKTRRALLRAMRQDGAKYCRMRRGEWIVYTGEPPSDKEEES